MRTRLRRQREAQELVVPYTKAATDLEAAAAAVVVLAVLVHREVLTPMVVLDSQATSLVQRFFTVAVAVAQVMAQRQASAAMAAAATAQTTLLMATPV
jgi:hypothetical protein